MTIRNNLMGEAASRYNSINDNKLTKTLEKLSSGYSVNRAADNAAGLAVSEKMRRLVSGLKQAENNISEGLEMFKVADGAMAELHNILRRQKELAVQSSNGNYTDETDRAAIQLEFEQLSRELEDITNGTFYNEQKIFYTDSDEGVINPDITDGDTIIKTGNLLVVDLPTGSNNTFSFYLDETRYDIDIPLGSYNRNQLTSYLNSQFTALGADVTAYFTEASESLRFETHGKVFDGFGGSMMYIDEANTPLPPDSILFDNLSYPKTIILSSHTGARTLDDTYVSGLTFASANNTMSFDFTDRNGNTSPVTITLSDSSYSSVNELVAEINAGLKTAGLESEVELINQSGRLKLSTIRNGSSLSLSKTGVYADLFRNTTSTNRRYTNAGRNATGGAEGAPGSGTLPINYAPVTVNSSNNQLSFRYNNISYDLTIPDGTYSDADSFATALGAAMTSAGVPDLTVDVNGGRLRFSNIAKTATLTGFSGELSDDLLGTRLTGSLSYTDGTIYKLEGDSTIYPQSSGYVQSTVSLSEPVVITSGVNDNLKLNINGSDVSINLAAGTYTRSALINELNSKLGGKATASLSGTSLRITNASAGNSTIGVNLNNVTGNAVDTLFRSRVNNSFSASGTPDSTGSPATIAYFYRSNYSGEYHDDNLTLDGTNNTVTFKVNNTDYTVTLDNGTYTQAALYDAIWNKASAHPTLNSLIRKNANLYGFEKIVAGQDGNFGISGTAANWLYTMKRDTDGTVTAPTVGEVYANGRVDMSGGDVIVEHDDVLTFDIVKDGVISSVDIKVPPGRYETAADFSDALNKALEDAGYPEMKASIEKVKRPNAPDINALRLTYTPETAGEYRLEGIRGKLAQKIFYDHPLMPDPVWLQVGAYSKDMYKTDIPILMTLALMRQNTNVATQKNANVAIDALDMAIDYVSSKRAITGADFNSLSHVYNLRQIQEENITDAESHIRDADMAAEYMDLQARRILQQSSQKSISQSMEVQKMTLDLMI
jgi:flagellin